MIKADDQNDSMLPCQLNNGFDVAKIGLIWHHWVMIRECLAIDCRRVNLVLKSKQHHLDDGETDFAAVLDDPFCFVKGM